MLVTLSGAEALLTLRNKEVKKGDLAKNGAPLQKVRTLTKNP